MAKTHPTRHKSRRRWNPQAKNWMRNRKKSKPLKGENSRKKEGS